MQQIFTRMSQNVSKNEPILGNDLINFLTQSKLQLLNATLFGSYFHDQYQILNKFRMGFLNTL